MPESSGDLVTIALGLTVLWFLWGSLASGEHRGRRGDRPASERPGGRDGGGESSRR